MTENDTTELEEFLRAEMLELKMMRLTVKKASKRFDWPLEEVEQIYLKVRSNVKRAALNRAIVYFLLGGIFLFVGVKAMFGGSGVILWGGLSFGLGGVLSALGYLILALKGSRKNYEDDI